MLIQWFKDRAARKTAAKALYQVALRQSRDPAFYMDLGVADTMDGRFDLACLHVFLMIERLERFGQEGKKLSQALFDVMFRNVDETLREQGVGDLGVPRHMQKMMKAFNGRAHAYHAAIAAQSPAAMELALVRNVYRAEGEAIPQGVFVLTDYALAAYTQLDHYSFDEFMGGHIAFPDHILRKKEAARA